MKMGKVANSGNDEFYTPLYAIKPIAKYLKPNSKIWCPFDTEDSLFVKYFREQGHKVVHSHIDDDGNFFDILTWNKDKSFQEFDYIISNPPYSKKGEVLEALFKLCKPFAMLVGVVALFESKKRFEMFRDNDFEIMYFDKRIAYFKDYSEQKPSLNPPFSSVYVCKGVLPKQIVFEEIEK